MANQNIQPIFIMPEGTFRSTGRAAQKANIAAGKLISETVRSTLGPKGMDKMIVSSMGDVVITNDGVTILEEMEIDHPAAKMMVEIARVQEEEVGDGTTTAVVIGGELLRNAENLLENNIHPTVIANGYRLAGEKAEEILKSLGRDVSIKNKDILEKIAKTAMTGKNVEYAKETLAKIAVEAIHNVLEESGGQYFVDFDNIKLEKREGGSSEESELIDGIVIDKERVNSGMPKQVKNAKILLLESAIEVKETGTDTKISISDPNQLQAFIDQEEKILKEITDKILKTGANVVFCQKGIDDFAQYYLAKAGIFAARRVKSSDMEKLAKACGAKIVTSFSGMDKSDLGFAGLVEEKKMGSDDMIFVRNCKNPKAVSVIVRGGTEHVVDEVERAIRDAIGDLAAAISVGKCVAGGGSIEVEVGKKLREYAESLSGKEQLAVKAFADALEVIPKTLSENAGLDPIDVITELKAKHDKGKEVAGINAFTGKVDDMWKLGVIEPLKIKTQAISSATEAAIMLLRIDDIISSGKSKMSPEMGAPGHGMM